MDKKKVSIYTDGACSRNPGYGGWAFIVLNDSEIYASRSGAVEKTTNNRMELTAAIQALTFVYGDKELMENSESITVYTDSQYVKRGATEWLYLWKERRWRNSDREPVKNRGMWEKLDALIQIMPIRWVWVRGHAGNEYNEICDKLTKDAVAALAKRLEAEGREREE